MQVLKKVRCSVRADTEDQLRVQPEPAGFPVVKLLIAVAVLAVVLLTWFWSGQEPTQESASAPLQVAPKPVVVPAPDIPRRPEPVPTPEPPPAAEAVTEHVEPAEPALPTQEESNELLRSELNAAGADARLKALVGTEHPLEISAALIDGMSRGIILRKILPADPPRQAFSVTTEGDFLYMSTDSYARYDSYADSIDSLNPTLIVMSFHLLRPLYERTYEQLGLDSEDFDNAVIRMLDVILATPEMEDAILLERKSVMYAYADPALEKLPSVQKQLLRMGPENIRRIKAQAQAVRNGLLNQ
jgi:hypothetical protein